MLFPIQIADSSTKKHLTNYIETDGTLGSYPAANNWGDIFTVNVTKRFSGKTIITAFVNTQSASTIQRIGHRILVNGINETAAINGDQWDYISTSASMNLMLTPFAILTLNSGNHVIKIQGLVTVSNIFVAPQNVLLTMMEIS